MQDACNCCCFASTEPDFELRCLRHAPVIQVGDACGVWPIVREIDWCGDFKRRLTSDELKAAFERLGDLAKVGF